MKITKALKLKNRLAGEISGLQGVISRENSRRDDNPSKVDVSSEFEKLNSKRKELIDLKGRIARATAPIAPKLAELSELKSSITFVSGLPTREGEELVGTLSKESVLKYKWTAFMNRERVDKEVVKLQESINSLQDEIDEFNATTDV